MRRIKNEDSLENIKYCQKVLQLYYGELNDIQDIIGNDAFGLLAFDDSIEVDANLSELINAYEFGKKFELRDRFDILNENLHKYTAIDISLYGTSRTLIESLTLQAFSIYEGFTRDFWGSCIYFFGNHQNNQVKLALANRKDLENFLKTFKCLPKWNANDWFSLFCQELTLKQDLVRKLKQDAELVRKHRNYLAHENRFETPLSAKYLEKELGRLSKLVSGLIKLIEHSDQTLKSLL